MGVNKNSGTPQIIHFNRVFRYKSSILIGFSPISDLLQGFHASTRPPQLKVKMQSTKDADGRIDPECVPSMGSDSGNFQTVFPSSKGESIRRNTLEKPTWFSKNMEVWKMMIFLFNWVIFRFPVNFQGCKRISQLKQCDFYLLYSCARGQESTNKVLCCGKTKFGMSNIQKSTDVFCCFHLPISQ